MEYRLKYCQVGQTRLVLAIMATLVLSACSSLRPEFEENKFRRQLKAPVQSPAYSQPDNDILPIDSSLADTFWLRPAYQTGELPAIPINGLSVTELGLFDVMQIIFANTNLALSFEGGGDGISRYGTVTLNNLSGTLPDVMEKLGEIMGFFWTVTDSGVVRIMPDQQFVVSMPPALGPDNLASMTNTLQYLGAKDVYLDRLNRSLVLRANRRALRDVDAYLQKARETSSLIVYDMNVLQVDLTDNNANGISWSAFRFDRALAGATDTGAGTGTGTGTGTGDTGAGLPQFSASDINQVSVDADSRGSVSALVFGNQFSTSLLLEFLRSQGDVKTLSQPKIGLLNGTNGSIRVGRKTTFVSSVGTQTLAGAPQNAQANTDELRTGLELSLTGEVHDSTIYTRIHLSITELLALESFTALGIELKLPQVADRELQTQVRCRPGDTVLLGGITISKASDAYAAGLNGMSKSKTSNQSELVVTIRPRVLRFANAKKPSDSMLDAGGTARLRPKNAQSTYPQSTLNNSGIATSRGISLALSPSLRITAPLAENKTSGGGHD